MLSHTLIRFVSAVRTLLPSKYNQIKLQSQYGNWRSVLIEVDLMNTIKLCVRHNIHLTRRQIVDA